MTDKEKAIVEKLLCSIETASSSALMATIEEYSAFLQACAIRVDLEKA